MCTAAGDQSSPAVDQDLVVWSDARSAASGLDVRGYDLTLQQEFPVVTAPAWQGQPTISDYRVVWTDARNGATDLWAAILTPWNAAISIDGGKAWTRSATASLQLFAQGKTGVVAQMTLANMGGPAGTPRPTGATKSPWYLTPGDGPKTVSVDLHRLERRLVADDVGVDHPRHPRSDHQRAGGRVGQTGRDGVDRLPRERQSLRRGSP